ncbi:hypothetical protein QF205_15680 [Luteimonas composti]|uniref:Uncharacterized protein n=1 Tax=Luteimonas composti TaxID=398257 RepID=A0ABT6MV35_9GAMM|nr:hypothetical protein [Luteimonas composti]MDH7454502.1 hypothetical protein [Luteimonas composti]
MHNRLFATGLAILAACASLLLPACTPGDGGGASAPVDLGPVDNPIRVVPALDPARAVTQTIGFAGGTITATGADGTVFTLAVPADSLRQLTRITMTPVTRLEGLPFGNGSDVTVDLQPSGLVFDVPATLTIAPATAIPPGERILYGYSDDQLSFAEPVMDADGIAIAVSHFSGYGAARGLMGDVEAARKRIGGSAEERITSEMRAIMQAARQAELRGESTNLASLLDPYFDQLQREVVIPRIEAAGQSCAAGRAAIQTVGSYAHQRVLLGYEDEAGDLVDELLETVAPKCMDEEYEMCVNEHIVHRIFPAYQAFSRQFSQRGIDNSPALGKMKVQVEKCLHFDLEFTLDTRFELDTRSINQSYLSYAESTELDAEVALSVDDAYVDMSNAFEPSSGPMESLKQVYRQKAPGCVPGTVSTWRDTGHFLAMQLITDPPDLLEGGGGVTDIEVELGLPSPTVTISGMSCAGVASAPAADLTGAPAAYLLNHGDGFIRDWQIHGATTAAGQAFVTATSEWSVMNRLSANASVEDVGIATLRHTPR